MRKTDNLESYRIFCAVAACGGVKEAGIELSMEPSNIFRLLRQLEEDLAVPLFIRQSHPIRLTEQGRLFFDHAQHILREQALMLEAIRDNLESDAGLIQIASTAGVRYQTLTPALVQYAGPRRARAKARLSQRHQAHWRPHRSEYLRGHDAHMSQK